MAYANLPSFICAFSSHTLSINSVLSLVYLAHTSFLCMFSRPKKHLLTITPLNMSIISLLHLLRHPEVFPGLSALVHISRMLFILSVFYLLFFLSWTVSSSMGGILSYFLLLLNSVSLAPNILPSTYQSFKNIHQMDLHTLTVLFFLTFMSLCLK